MNTQPKSFPVKAYSVFARGATFLQCPFLLAIRIIWGWQFFIAGKGKLGNLDNVTKFFGEDLHIPFPRLNAILASSTETFGGLLLLVGLGSRLVSLPLAITMLVAYITAEKPHSLDKFVAGAPFPFLFTALVVLCFGPGKLSLDYLLQRFVFQTPSLPGPDRRAAPSPARRGEKQIPSSNPQPRAAE